MFAIRLKTEHIPTQINDTQKRNPKKYLTGFSENVQKTERKGTNISCMTEAVMWSETDGLTTRPV